MPLPSPNCKVRGQEKVQMIYSNLPKITQSQDSKTQTRSCLVIHLEESEWEEKKERARYESWLHGSGMR